MADIIRGFDTGFNGAYAELSMKGEFVSAGIFSKTTASVPYANLYELNASKKDKRRLSLVKQRHLYPYAVASFVEETYLGQRRSKKSVATTERNFYATLMVARANSKMTFLVRPKQWQQMFDGEYAYYDGGFDLSTISDTKRNGAAGLYKLGLLEHAVHKGTLHEGIIDALCIAYFGVEYVRQQQ